VAALTSDQHLTVTVAGSHRPGSVGRYPFSPHISAYAIAFLAFSLSNVLRPLNILVANDYRYLQLDIEEIEIENVKSVQKRPINDHDYDSPSLKFAYAGNMQKNMPPYMRRIFRQIPHIFLHILPQKVSHILRKFSTINQHPYLVRPIPKTIWTVIKYVKIADF